ncbi:MAG: DUF4349 domain-containing protein [Chitinispirillales bacterium]|jgi:hypothetical protein|nr:DUF4349 domain-containing protein [Chitinispirillales bacterium]
MSFEGADDIGYLDNPTPVEASRRDRQDINAGERMVAYSAYLELSVKKVEDTKEMVLEQIKHSKGFIVSETGNSVRARIPSKNMDSFLNNVKMLGKVKFESKSGEDITDQYRDNTVALNSLKVVRDRYMALLEKAEAVDDILKVEKELERLNLAIEKLEGRIKYAEQSVSYSIVTVGLGVPVKLGPVGLVFYGLYHGIAWLFVR